MSRNHKHRHRSKHGDKHGEIYRQHHRRDGDDSGRHGSSTPRNTLRIESSDHYHSRQERDSTRTTPRNPLMLESADRYHSRHNSDSHGEIIVEERVDEYDLDDYGDMTQDDWDSVERVLHKIAESKRQPAAWEQRDHVAERRRDEEEWNRNKKIKEDSARYMKKFIKEVFEDNNDKYGLRNDAKGGICSNIADEVEGLRHASFDFDSKITDKENAFVRILVGCLDSKIKDEETDSQVRKRCQAKKTKIQEMFA